MSPFDTAIIGAGAAGIAAARTLIPAGRRVVLLEARQRTGGRAVTDHSLGVPADLGAAWLHFARENAWTQLAEEAGFTLDRRRPGWGAGAAIGAHVPDEAEREAAGAAYARYFGAVDAAAEAGHDVPVADVVPHDAYRPRFDAVMTWAVGVESHAVSTLDLHRYAESEHDWGVPAGLGSVVAQVAQGLPIQTGFVVTDIHWSGALVRIEGTAGRIEARSVIVTMPTAVLAAGGVRFHPPLPPAWRDALQMLPLGVVNKVFFRLATPPEALGIPLHFLGSDATSRTCSYSVGAGGQPLLMAFCGGDLSADLERRGELAPFARSELLSLFGADFARHLGATLTTGWGGDPFARGSYSAARPGHARSREQLALPVSPQLQFAGEACSPAYYGTLYGAWLSGREAAGRLL